MIRLLRKVDFGQGRVVLVTRRVPSLLITPETKRMQRKNDGGKKIQLWLANDIIAGVSLLFSAALSPAKALFLLWRHF
jgi:hypothetical protein